jgi:hypothetical protein
MGAWLADLGLDYHVCPATFADPDAGWADYVCDMPNLERLAVKCY